VPSRRRAWRSYGRSLVEAMRCGLPVLTMGTSNLHVVHDHTGLLADDAAQLGEHIARVASDGALRRRLAANVADEQRRSGSPDAEMLRAVLEARARTFDGGGRAPPRLPVHWLWTPFTLLAHVADHPEYFAACGALLVLLLVVLCCACSRCRRRGATTRRPEQTKSKRL
tara:strand:+ start:1568 stop:2074 length:507 start_codon:yes stop_codon:yes gene_type:complete